MTTVGNLGESGLIERIAATVAEANLAAPTAGGFELRLGIGDDAAAWTIASGVEVSTTDTMVEGVHFTRETTPWADVGWKLWAANVSDVASMGAVPLTGVVTLALPNDLAIEAIDELYAGMLDACRCYGTLLVGGDVVSAREVIVTVAMNGVCDGDPLRRDTARPGDLVALTGPVGASAGGLRAMRRGIKGVGVDNLIAAHRRPMPRVEAGQALQEAGVTCAMDVSDGLAADLGKMCRASGVGARLDAFYVPMTPALLAVFGDDALELALGGGEDYELVFAAPRAAVERAMASLSGVAIVGGIVEGSGVRVVGADGEELPLTDRGWEHLG
jgi:thiamine-monophosphate kinase